MNEPLRDYVFSQLPKGSLLDATHTNEWLDRKGNNRGILFEVSYRAPGSQIIRKKTLNAAMVLGYLFTEALGGAETYSMKEAR